MSASEEIAELRRQLELAKARNAETQQEIELNKARVAQNQQEIELNKARVAQMQQEIGLTKARVAQNQQEIELNKARVAQMQQEIGLNKARVAQMQQEYERPRLEARKTTLLEYLHNCHSHLYKSLRLANPSMPTEGSTNVLGKFYPKRLRLWTQFADVLHPRYFDLVRKTCGQSQLFEPANTTKCLGAIISDDLGSHEKSVERFEGDAVERPVRRILQVLATHEEADREYRFADLRFSSIPLGLTQASDGSEITDDVRPKTWPDGIGLRTRPGGGRSSAFVYDYKAAHRIAIEHLQSAVAKEQLFLDVVARVNGATLSSNTEVNDGEMAEAFVAMALTQAFDYMITFGVSYGYVATGRTSFLLFVDRNDLQTLYCHPCMPGVDVGEPTGDGADGLSRTAVAQMVSFCLLSLQSDAVEGSSLNAELSRAQTTLQTWPAPYGDAASLLGLRSQSSFKPAGVLPQGDEDDKEDREDHSARDASRSLNKSGSEDEDVAMVDSAPTRPYCTQACLLGLKRGGDLDKNCPNASLHRPDGSSRHPINADQFTDLVHQQLLRDPYQKCQTVDFWGKRGAIGWLFKLELSLHGYTFVGKGTLERRLNRLEHEGQVYARLDHLQGEVVPVHLGLVRLDPGYIVPGARYIVHMMLMSWAGETPGVSTDDVKTSKMESLTAIARYGVDHGDDCSANYLWNAERRRIMIIDFERARLLLPLPEPQAVSRLKKKQKRRDRSVADARKRRAPDGCRPA